MIKLPFSKSMKLLYLKLIDEEVDKLNKFTLNNKICCICGKPNERTHQSFCQNLSCSGRMIEKPTIRVYTNGDIDISYIDVYCKFYSRATTTFRNRSIPVEVPLYE